MKIFNLIIVTISGIICFFLITIILAGINCEGERCIITIFRIPAILTSILSGCLCIMYVRRLIKNNDSSIKRWIQSVKLIL